jgi:hypothetical protein
MSPLYHELVFTARERSSPSERTEFSNEFLMRGLAWETHRRTSKRIKRNVVENWNVAIAFIDLEYKPIEQYFTKFRGRAVWFDSGRPDPIKLRNLPVPFASFQTRACRTFQCRSHVRIDDLVWQVFGALKSLSKQIWSCGKKIDAVVNDHRLTWPFTSRRFSGFAVGLRWHDSSKSQVAARGQMLRLKQSASIE